MTLGRKGIRITGMPRLILIGMLGGFLGLIVASQWNPLPLIPRTRVVPDTYRIPKIPGGTPLRLAMVHDVLHERYLRHGTAWYQRRNELARAIIAHDSGATAAAPPVTLLDAMDDLAIGLQNAGQFDESIALLRQKLALVSPLPATATPQPATLRADLKSRNDVDADDLRRILAAQNLTPIQHHQYTTCANLGTVLVHSAMAKALTGDPKAVATVREGLEFIERAIAINPGAHFGRETWQAIAVEHFLAAIHHPELVTEFDIIGNSLDSKDRIVSGPVRFHGRGNLSAPEAGLTPDERVSFRRLITRVGIEPEWAAIVHPDYLQPMPFDEPTLAIIGMWTLGGGPSPHFALALGTIMETIGERNIAWNAYERAVELGDKFWPDPTAAQKLVAYCRTRQREIATQEDAGNETAWQNTMRTQHQKELAWGLKYQKDYQDYEAAQIAAGASIDDPHFHDAFFTGRPSIASPPGLSDDLIVTQKEATRLEDVLPCVMIGAGLAMTIGLVRRDK